MRIEDEAAPAPGQPIDSSPSQVLVANNGTATVINVPLTAPTHVDVRIRDRFVRYTSDPRPDAGTPGLWRTGGDGVREQVSPFTLQRITVGRQGVEIIVSHPKTQNVWMFEGDLDTVASLLQRAGRPHGCRAERKTVYWALHEFCDHVKQQAAARGVSQ